MDPVLATLSGSVVIRAAAPRAEDEPLGDPATVGSLAEVIEQAVVAEYVRLGLEVSVNVSLTRTDRQMATVSVVNASIKELAAAFTEWDRRYREEPDRFWSEARRLLKETPKTYGEACAPYLASILAQQAEKR